MADRPPWENLSSFVRGLPDDKGRLQLLQALAEAGGQASAADLARRMTTLTSGEVAEVIIAAAKDGLVQFVEGDSGVRITGLGRKLADQQARKAF